MTKVTPNAPEHVIEHRGRHARRSPDFSEGTTGYRPRRTRASASCRSRRGETRDHLEISKRYSRSALRHFSRSSAWSVESSLSSLIALNIEGQVWQLYKLYHEVIAPRL